MRPRYRLPYDPETTAKAREHTDVIPRGISLTKQSMKDDVDLNVMMARMGVKDGAIPIAKDETFYGEPQQFGEGFDLKDVLDRSLEAREHFDRLPAKLRDRFDHSPAKMHAFVTNPENADEAVRLGLLKRREAAPAPSPSTSETPVT